MAKRRLMAYVGLATVKWLDRRISGGVYASYSHAINRGLKLLRKEFLQTQKLVMNNNSKKVRFVKNGSRIYNA